MYYLLSFRVKNEEGNFSIMKHIDLLTEKDEFHFYDEDLKPFKVDKTELMRLTLLNFLESNIFTIHSPVIRENQVSKTIRIVTYEYLIHNVETFSKRRILNMWNLETIFERLKR